MGMNRLKIKMFTSAKTSVSVGTNTSACCTVLLSHNQCTNWNKRWFVVRYSKMENKTFKNNLNSFSGSQCQTKQ